MEDYKAIKEIIDDIIGVETKSGENLKIAIKNYFDTKLKNLKLINSEINESMNFSSINLFKTEAELAMKRYTAQLQKELKKMGTKK